MRDSSIQKRLSWNYGQHIPNNELQLKNKHVNKCLSSDSMRSSSGVSSTGSLHLSIGSELENSAEANGREAELAGQQVQVRPQQQSTSPVSPFSAQRSLSHQRSLTGGASKAPPPPVPPRNFTAALAQSHVSTTYITQDDVVVSHSPKLAVRAKGETVMGHVPSVSVPQVQVRI